MLVAKGAYHGAAPWCITRLARVVSEDRAHLIKFRYNHIESFRAAIEAAGNDLAAVVVSPFRHDARHDQELVDPTFARDIRSACDEHDAALILDDVRCGLRLANGSSWEPLGVRPDLSAWGKAIANGQPLAGVLGNERFREQASKICVTGSFWFAAVAMAAAIATINTIRDEGAVQPITAAGDRLRAGLAAQARSHGLTSNQTGPSPTPMMTFASDVDFARANLWAATTAANGAYFHPWHNWFTNGHPNSRRRRSRPPRHRRRLRRRTGPIRSRLMDVGIVGGGWIAQSVVDALSIYGANIVGLCDPDTTRREAWTSRGYRTIASMDDLLACTRPGVVAVLTPTSTHAALTLQALEDGIDVIVEKPLASNITEARLIVERAALLRRHVLVDESCRGCRATARRSLPSTPTASGRSQRSCTPSSDGSRARSASLPSRPRTRRGDGPTAATRG